jgi:uncharacterized phage-associated protein
MSPRYALNTLTPVIAVLKNGTSDAPTIGERVSSKPASANVAAEGKERTAMYNLTFEFSSEKLVQAIAFFSTAGIRDLTKLKIAKLLYFADKQHLLEHGRPIIGDVYWCMDWGPVPSFALNEMNEAIDRLEVPLADCSDAQLFNRVLNVRKPFFGTHPKFEVKEGAYDPSVFSDSELQALRHTTDVYGLKSAVELVDLTHREPTWVLANQTRPPRGRVLITYDLFFQGAPEKSQRLLAKLVAEQFGAAIPLHGDAEYAAFANDLASYDFAPDEIADSDLRSGSRYSRV